MLTSGPRQVLPAGPELPEVPCQQPLPVLRQQQPQQASALLLADWQQAVLPSELGAEL